MTYARGIDISHWQATTPSLSAQEFVFARATYGTALDTKYLTHAQATRDAGLVLGAYHFGRAGSINPIRDQAAVFATRARTADLRVLDLENDAGNPDMTNAEAREFIGRVQDATGEGVGLYASESGFPSVGQAWNWVANWSAKPSIPWRFWQYTNDYRIAGYAGRLDGDYFNGDAAALRQFVKGENVATKQIAITSTTPQRIDVIPVGADILDLDGAKIFENHVVRQNVFSPYGRGSIGVAGERWPRREWVLDPDGTGPDTKRTVLTAVDPESMTPWTAPPAPAVRTRVTIEGADVTVAQEPIP